MNRLPRPSPQLMIEVLPIGNSNSKGGHGRAEENRTAGQRNAETSEGPFTKVPGSSVANLAITVGGFVAIEDPDGVLAGDLIRVVLLEVKKTFVSPFKGKSEDLPRALTAEVRNLLGWRLGTMEKNVGLKAGNLKVRLGVKKGDRVPAPKPRYLQPVGT